jgi:predicted Fe-S protein YdhL (DUF1289 family)
MVFWNIAKPKPVLSPCVGICALDAAGYCRGCRRTLDEIAGWASLSDSERATLMDEVLPQRAEPAAS